MNSGRTARVQGGERNSVLRQMVEKRLDVQSSMAMGFIDLEKAFDTPPREVVMATLLCMGIPEDEGGMVASTYEMTTGRVVVGEGASRSLMSRYDCARCC